MLSAVPAPPASRRRVPEMAQRLLGPMARLLETGDSAATVDRLFSSQHVKDLQLIVAVAFFGVCLAFLIGFGLSIGYFAASCTPAANCLYVGFTAAGDFLTFFTPVLGVFGLVLAWAYQVGSARLGVVDLFACEISTLCRVAVVFDAAHQYVVRFEKGRPRSRPEPAHLKRRRTRSPRMKTIFRYLRVARGTCRPWKPGS